MSPIQKILLVCLPLLFPLLLLAQYPTAVGTKWEYYQFREDFLVQQDMIDAWQDEVVGDTVAGGNTYQIVRRTGALYTGSGPILMMQFDTLNGTFYTRVVGTQVWVLDSVVMGNALESLLYEFGFPVGGQMPDIIKNVVNLTPGGREPMSHAQRFDNEEACAPSYCDPVVNFNLRAANLPFWPACSTWSASYRNLHLADVGILFSEPFLVILDQYGEPYYLKRLTSNGQVLYQTDLITAVDDPVSSDGDLRVFPNPATQELRFACTTTVLGIKLLDATGKTVLQSHGDGLAMEGTLDVHALPRGLYWLVVQGESGIASRAVVLR